jgi:hypothetical protein
MVRSSCKSGVLQHPINKIHIINSRKLQKIKMRPRIANQSEEKNTKKTLNPATQQTRDPRRQTLNPATQ